MADTTFSSHIVTDPHTLLGTTRAIAARLAPQAGLRRDYAGLLIEQLHLLFIDTQRLLFVFGAPNQATLTQVNLYARTALENALGEIFQEKTSFELVVFEDGRDSLPDLIARFTGDLPNESAQSLTVPTLRTVNAPTLSSARTRTRAVGLNPLQLEIVADSLRGVFTSPKRVVVVPGYLLRWIPYIGPLRMSIIVACFQAFYHSRGMTAKASQTFEAPGPFLAAVAGIAESSIWRHLEDRELGWFIKKVPYGPDESRWIRDEGAGLTKKRPTRFIFRSTAPLTPGDAEALSAYLADLDIDKNPLEVLTELVRGQYRVEPRDIFPFPAPPPHRDWLEGDPDRCLIHNVIYSAIGIEARSASRDLASLVDDLVERLLPANDQVHVSWYYLLHWLPLLGHGPGWATILLRDRCYYNRLTGELRDTVSLRAGYQELAGALGLQRTKTVREWFPAPHAQNEADKFADLSSPEFLEEISRSKRSFVRLYAAKFVEITEADADGRGQVASFKAKVNLSDPLIPLHEALFYIMFPIVQAYFALSEEQRQGFLNAFETSASLDVCSTEQIIQETSKEVDTIIMNRGLSVQPGATGSLDWAAATDFLGAIERITAVNPGANRSIIDMDAGANERIASTDLGAFRRMASFILGAFEWITDSHPGAIETLGRIFWAHMRGLKYMVLNNHLDESLQEYMRNTDLENLFQKNSTTTSQDQGKRSGGNGREAEQDKNKIVEKWDLSSLLNTFSPNTRRMMLEKDLSVEALISCLLYIASSKGDNLGLGYVVDKLKWDSKEGQGGIYLRLAKHGPEEIVARLQHYIEYHNFQNRDWRVAMGTPSVEKILELLEHLGIDSSRFGSGEEWG